MTRIWIYNNSNHLILEVIVIDPATARLVIQVAIQVVTDEETRKRLFTILMIPVIAAVLILSMAYYILTNPIEVLSATFNNRQHTVYAQNLQRDYGYIGGDAVIDISSDYVTNKIPLFLQTDNRWRNFPYGKTGTIGSSGCGPTSLSMVIVGLTGDTSVNPKIVADWSYANGYCVEGVGSSWGLFPNGAEHWGINCEELTVSANKIAENLKLGKPVITSMAPGHFTSQGHFIVLYGITENGKILLNDPNSTSRSKQEWDMSIIISETRGTWAFSK